MLINAVILIIMCFLSLSLFQYYYSIKDISVGGMCICYGHAKACPLNTLTKVKYLTLCFCLST